MRRRLTFAALALSFAALACTAADARACDVDENPIRVFAPPPVRTPPLRDGSALLTQARELDAAADARAARAATLESDARTTLARAQRLRNAASAAAGRSADEREALLAHADGLEADAEVARALAAEARATVRQLRADARALREQATRLVQLRRPDWQIPRKPPVISRRDMDL